MTAPTESVSDPRAVSRDIFSASIGSVFCCAVGQPFDTVKVRIQTSPLQFPNVFTASYRILANEGITAFWKGAVPTVGGMIAENAAAFGVNEALKRKFPVNEEEAHRVNMGLQRPDLTRPFIMGLMTGLFIAPFPMPGEIIKAKMQVVVGKSATSQEVIKQMIAKQGYSSFACGMEAQMARDGAFYAVFFGGYELFKYMFRTNVPSMPDELNFFLSGGFAGCVGWCLAMPFDVPKTNVQARYDTKVVGSYIPEMIKIVKTRGILSLYDGLGPTLLRAFPANAALFLGVELGKRAFDNYIWPARHVSSMQPQPQSASI